ncbi:MAG: flagellar motor switch protein FliN [Spirochaetota bacterium]|nr:flagellar motor switch protein FliN [Spirochaetota bacterium]
MGDGSLSQDEIDALLQGTDDVLTTPSMTPQVDAGGRGGALSPVERDSLADLLNVSMNIVAPSLSGYLSKNVQISNALVEIKSEGEVRNDFGRQYVQLPVDFAGGFIGKNLILFNINDAGIISSLMMGDEAGVPPEELTEAHQSTIQEFVSQMLSSNATEFSNKFGKSVTVSAPVLSIVNDASQLQLPHGAELVKITYNLIIEELVNSKFYQIMELPLASELVRSSMSESQFVSQQSSQSQQMAQQDQQGQVGISPVKFPPLGEGVPYGTGGNISLLLDVPMTLTVELGRTRQLVKDILGLGEGSIIELDKLAGEPVDLLVNGKLIAKGEVVVIDENFGVRVTDIVSPAERLSKLQ